MERILEVDDDAVMARTIHKMLAESYSSFMAGSGKDAIKYLEKYEADLVLLDVNMPEMDGFETLLKIREIRGLEDLPVLFLTAEDNSNIEIKCLQAGASDFIRKPVVPEVLRLRVSHILELYKLRNNLASEVEKQTDKIRRQQDIMRLMSMQMVYALSDTIEAKDKYTNGHSHRVAEYSKEIARRFGYSDEKLDEVMTTGLLHDVGKIGVPDTIINKTGKLDDDEYALMKKHPAIGAGILEKITTVPDIAIGAHWHHERYDGKGYPDGLKGEEIPEIARIIGVADAYDAMTSRRSYRDVMSQEKVREQIVNGRGTQFDPVFADIMLEMIDEDKEYKLRGNIS